MYIQPDLLQYTFDIYKRRSSDDADHQVASLESQHEVLLKLVKENNMKIGRTAEESMSAKQPGRPVFNEEIETARRNVRREILLILASVKIVITNKGNGASF